VQTDHDYDTLPFNPSNSRYDCLPGHLCPWPSTLCDPLDTGCPPLLGFLYAIALINRTNMGIARIAGMERDLVSSPGSYRKWSLTEGLSNVETESMSASSIGSRR
jgi:hypothetical protein